MTTPISEVVRKIGQNLAKSTEALSVGLIGNLNQLLGPAFQAVSSVVRDTDGVESEKLDVVVCQSPELSQHIGRVVPADAAACVIECVDRIDLHSLGLAYERVASAKRLKKTSSSKVSKIPKQTATLGLILARHSDVSFEDLAAEFDRLNRSHPDSEWTDMLAILSVGSISFAVQFPGDKGLGDYLPPDPAANKAGGGPPIYVVLTMRPVAEYTFNRLFAFLISQLNFFSPGVPVPPFVEVLKGVPQFGVTLWGYQYDLSGHLKPVPRELYNDRYLAPRPLRVEDQQGNLLANLSFIPWQDGGVIMLQGKLPLVGLMVFLGKDALKNAGVLTTPSGSQLSYVLPITQTDFATFLQRIQKQSNMVVKRDSTKFVVQQLMDEGTSSPFVARLYLGILRLRDIVFPDETKRREFDEAFELVMNNLVNARNAARELSRTIAEHDNKLRSGEAATLKGNALHIKTSIDVPLQREFASFLNFSGKTIKEGMQKLTAFLQLDIGFLFQKPNGFEKGVSEMEKSDIPMGTYLRAARVWSGPLQELRNAYEHEGRKLPRIIYGENAGVVSMTEPQIDTMTVTKFAELTVDHLSCFVEEVTAECLKRLMPPGISIREVSIAERDPDVAERFQVIVEDGVAKPWIIAPHAGRFAAI